MEDKLEYKQLIRGKTSSKGSKASKITPGEKMMLDPKEKEVNGSDKKNGEDDQKEQQVQGEEDRGMLNGEPTPIKLEQEGQAQPVCDDVKGEDQNEC